MCDFTGGQAHGGSDGKSEAEAISKKGRRWCRGAAVRPRPYATADTNKNQSGLHGREPIGPTSYISKVHGGHKKYRNYQI